MGLFLFRFWPVLLPFMLYMGWFLIVRHKAVKSGAEAPKFPLYWLIITTLLMAAICFVLLATTQDVQKGDYVPPHMDNGTLVPSEVKKKP